MNLLSCVKNIEHLNFYPLGNNSDIAMKKQMRKDRKNRKLFNQKELSYVILKSIIKNENFSLTIK